MFFIDIKVGLIFQKIWFVSRLSIDYEIIIKDGNCDVFVCIVKYRNNTINIFYIFCVVDFSFVF